MKAKKLTVTRVMWKVAMPTLIFMLVAVAGPRIASAHAKLVSSTPSDGSTVASGLTQVVMNFGEELSLDQSTAQLMMPNGTQMQGATAAVDRADRKKMALAASSALPDGKYTVKWKSVTEDDNGITNGTFSFTVGSPGGVTTQSGSTQAATSAPSSMSGDSSGGSSNSGSVSSGTAGNLPTSSGSLPGTGDVEAMQIVALGVMFAALMLLSAGFAARRRS